MAVAFNSSSSAARGSGTSISFSYTSSSGSDRLLVAGTATFSGQTFTSGSYAGASLTNVTTNARLKTWRKTAPATGANTMAFAMSAYSSNNGVTVADFTGVDQTTPLGTAVTNSGTSAAPSTGSITVPASGMAWGVQSHGYSSSVPTISAGTLAGAFREGAGGTTGAGGYRSTTGAISWSVGNSNNWYANGHPINAVAAALAPVLRRGGASLSNLFSM